MGKLVQTDTGTLLLDEIGALPAATQETLDRVLATGEVRPVGLNGSQSVDVRVIATSSRPLPDDFHAGLAERIGATTVMLPALRDRSSDIPALARHFLSRLPTRLGSGPCRSATTHWRCSCAMAGRATSASWRACSSVPRCSATANSLTAEHFPHIAIQSRYSARRTDFAPTLSEARSEQRSRERPACHSIQERRPSAPLEEIEADIIRLAIGHYRGRMTEVARRLGIGRSTLYRKLGDLGIDTAA